MPEMSGKRHVFASQVPLGLASGRTGAPMGRSGWGVFLTRCGLSQGGAGGRRASVRWLPKRIDRIGPSTQWSVVLALGA